MKLMLGTCYDVNNHVLTVMLPLHEIKHKVLSFNVEYDVHRHFGMWHHILKDADDATKGYYEYANFVLSHSQLYDLNFSFFAAGDIPLHYKAVVHADINRLYLSIPVNKIHECVDIDYSTFKIEINNKDRDISVVWSYHNVETNHTTREVIPVEGNNYEKVTLNEED